ncbi:LAGLIDADG family homing endonuclease [Bacillus sp. V5-8f]|uniref:LAGLIDADG family homing endonuclease n=1 Tax=Bacillus sp. V5-8f TaxID=2053044 RepID=UPI000C78A53C|nr:LAGLIDADG family homing endonuclease [Bacillus sp. V5-8f]PLT31977.1 hypothetical protein CUU64_20540 [Bacillus sp. V5-8f]
MPGKILPNRDFLSLLGFYLAEGFSSLKSNKGRFISLSAHTKEEYILKNFAKYLSEQFGVKSAIYPKSDGTQGIGLRAYSIDLAFLFAHLFGNGAINKRIPDFIMNLPKKLIPFLQFYLEGD